MDEDVGAGVGAAERARHAGGAGPTSEPRRRMSAGRRVETPLTQASWITATRAFSDVLRGSRKGGK